jgi:hypothetical protein
MTTVSNDFGPWKAEKHEEKDRGYLVVRRMISTPGITRYHRSSGGGHVWYTKSGADKKAAALNTEEERNG